LREILREERRSEDQDDEDETSAGRDLDLPRGDERVGTSGIEAMFDAELRGRDGRLESTSLEEFESDGLLEPAVDGGDVVLTLDRDLQLAAEETLEHPVEPRDGKTTDSLWFANPVGAIVLLAPDGEVLAAASGPRKSGLSPTPGRDLERTFARERTLTLPRFNPPGSSIKPFVAAYALDKLGLDPNEELGCGPPADGGRVPRRGGHDALPRRRPRELQPRERARGLVQRDLRADRRALPARRSPRHGAHVRVRPPDGDPPLRPGRRRSAQGPPRAALEDPGTARGRSRPGHLPHAVRERPRHRRGDADTDRARWRARHGRLPDVRLVRKVAGRDVEARSTELPISKHARNGPQDLEGVVRPAVAFDTGLDVQTLGFSFACKTGTADTHHIEGGRGSARTARSRCASETWIVGWFLEEDRRRSSSS
jgi:cell division protein FtsI/penicillin-binding protein 2